MKVTYLLFPKLNHLTSEVPLNTLTIKDQIQIVFEEHWRAAEWSCSVPQSDAQLMLTVVSTQIHAYNCT